MFLFEKMPWYAALMGVAVLIGLIVINELTRRSKPLAIFTYLALPILLTAFVWPKTSGPGTPMGYWFPWVKTYSALAGVLGFMALRYVKGLDKNKWMLEFPAFILSLNILEAVIRDFQCFGYNGIAGILNIITIDSTQDSCCCYPVRFQHFSSKKGHGSSIVLRP